MNHSTIRQTFNLRLKNRSLEPPEMRCSMYMYMHMYIIVYAYYRFNRMCDIDMYMIVYMYIHTRVCVCVCVCFMTLENTIRFSPPFPFPRRWFQGEHIVLILQLLRAWGHSLMDAEGKYMEQAE